jgi:O-antigen/teichoic acid export membrane protein
MSVSKDLSLLKSISKGTAWSAIAAGTAQLSMLGAVLIISMHVQNSILGEFLFLQTTVTSLGLLIGQGLGTSTVRNIATFESKDAQRLHNILALNKFTTIATGAGAAIILAILAEAIAVNLVKQPNLINPLRIASIAVFFLAIDSHYKNILIGRRNIREYASSTITGALVSAILSAVLTINYGITGAAYALFLSSAIQAIISLTISRAIHPTGHTINRAVPHTEWRTLVEFALPSFLAMTMVMPVHWITQTMLAATPKGFAEVALLAIAMQWYNAIVFIPQATGKVITPILTRFASEGRSNQTKSVLFTTIASTAAFAVPIAAGVALLSPAILSVYGIIDEKGALVLSTAAAAAVISAIQNPIGNMIVAQSKIWHGFAMNAAWAIVFLMSAYELLEDGALGVIRSLLVAYVIHLLWTSIFVRRHILKPGQ